MALSVAPRHEDRVVGLAPAVRRSGDDLEPSPCARPWRPARRRRRRGRRAPCPPRRTPAPPWRPRRRRGRCRGISCSTSGRRPPPNSIPAAPPASRPMRASRPASLHSLQDGSISTARASGASSSAPITMPAPAHSSAPRAMPPVAMPKPGSAWEVSWRCSMVWARWRSPSAPTATSLPPSEPRPSARRRAASSSSKMPMIRSSVAVLAMSSTSGRAVRGWTYPAGGR